FTGSIHKKANLIRDWRNKRRFGGITGKVGGIWTSVKKKDIIHPVSGVFFLPRFVFTSLGGLCLKEQ
ncbi:MAG: hypothetical protein ACJ8MO_24095, partial [Bacillus sp. (in: firmicutes)]